MALSDAQVYSGDGSTRDFTILGEILSESHLRVWINDELQSSDDWDLLGNSVLFDTAPLVDDIVQFLVSTTGTDFPSNPSAVGNVSIYINEVIALSNALPTIIPLLDISSEIVVLSGITTEMVGLYADIVEILK